MSRPGKSGVTISERANSDSSEVISTLDVVQGIRHLLPRVAAPLPPALTIQPRAHPASFVRAAVSGVSREALLAACLTGVMRLLCRGSWRRTLSIAVSMPLSILTSIMVLSCLGEPMHSMTLGGVALAIGILVDDATVEIEPTNRTYEPIPIGGW
jgi:multidrug efflux pump subunit AcrB